LPVPTLGNCGTFGGTAVTTTGVSRWLHERDPASNREFLVRNALSLACFAIFAVASVAQSLTGWRSEVADSVQHGEGAISFWNYLTTSHFFEATFENWESEFLQMGRFVLLTVYLLQRGSGESKQETDDPRLSRVLVQSFRTGRASSSPSAPSSS